MAQNTSPAQPTLSTVNDSLALSRNVTPHPEFWFDDGSVILVARTGVGFKVYRGLIASQSSVFADMFASSTSSEGESLDGCPIVHLSDSPEELAHLLRVLIPSSQRYFHPRPTDSKRSFDEVAAVACLAHKYNIQDVMEQALFSLQESRFGSSLDGFKATAAGAVDIKPVHAIGVVNLARLTNTPLMLPPALYVCCLQKGGLLDGWKRDDGKVEHLSTEDLRTCINAQSRLLQEGWWTFSRIFTDAPSEKCTSREHCRSTLQTIFVQTARGDNQSGMRYILGNWTPSIERAKRLRICSECERELLARNEKERKRNWERLPEILNINVEGWPSGSSSASPDPTSDTA